MTTTNAELRALAEKATPGPWHEWDRGIGYEVHIGASPCPMLDEKAKWCVCLNDEMRETFQEHDAAYIAAAHPARIIELLGEVELYEKENQTLHGLVDLKVAEIVEGDAIEAALRAKLDLAMRALEHIEGKTGDHDTTEALAQLKEQP